MAERDEPADTNIPRTEVAVTDGKLSSTQSQNTPWPRLARQDYQTEPGPVAASGKQSGNPFQMWMWITLQACGFGLLLGGYFLGQAWAFRARPASAGHTTKGGIPGSQPVRSGGERALEAANRALKAERARDFQAAKAIYEEMTKRQAPLAGVEYRLALIALHQGNIQQTEAHLNRSVSAEESVGDCYFFRASLAGMKSNYADASTQFAAAVRSEPFNAKFLFCWGESLRRDGHLPEAIQRLAQALDRPDNAAARGLLLFKLRLAKVEAGGDVVFDAELARELAGSYPDGDWLLLGAAREIGRKNYSAAANWLEKAKKVLRLEVFRNYLQDYLFQDHRDQPELVSVLSVPPPPDPPKDAPLQDPAVWTAAEADPATWPPFAKAE